MTNVQEAAEKLRSLTYRGLGEWRTPSGETLDEEDVNKLRAELASEFLEPDDAELLDEAYLRTTNIQFGRTRLNIGRFGRINVDVVDMIGLTVWVNGESLDWPITRGDVRLLCRALGIPLTARRQEPT